MKKYLLWGLVFGASPSGAQTPEQLLPHMQAVSPQRDVISYNVAGVDILQLRSQRDFEPKSFLRDFKDWGLMSKDLSPVPGLPTGGYYATKKVKSVGGASEVHYYFVPSGSRGVTGLQFSGWGKTEAGFEHAFIRMLLETPVPQTAFQPAKFDSIEFAGRKFWTGESCYWTNVACAQCPKMGEMNWSLHPTLESAVKTASNQYQDVDSRKGSKIVSEDSVAILFEGTPVKARKVVYDFTGFTGVLLKIEGSKRLTVYYVAAPVRNHFVSWTGSFWASDVIGKETRLPPLLEQVMKLEN
jgi:hypothetical protein